jgi:hypothetical protein
MRIPKNHRISPEGAKQDWNRKTLASHKLFDIMSFQYHGKVGVLVCALDFKCD